MINNLEIKTLDADEIKTLYIDRLTKDFPPDELKPLSMIMRDMERDAYVCYGAVAGETILAYAFFVKCGKDAMVDYYAVKDDMRDTGIGSRFIQDLISGPLQEMNCVLLEVEDPDCAHDLGEWENRNRSLDFYRRNGLMETGVKAAIWGVAYCILELPVGERHTADTIAAVYADIYHSMLPDAIYDERVRIDGPEDHGSEP